MESNGTYCRVYDSRHLQGDCQELGSAPEPYALQLSMGYRTFTFTPKILSFHYTHTHTHTHTQPFNSLWSGTTRVGRYQKKHSPTHTHPDHRTSFINFLHLLHSIASSLFSLCARQSSSTTSLQVLFGLHYTKHCKYTAKCNVLRRQFYDTQLLNQPE